MTPDAIIYARNIICLFIVRVSVKFNSFPKIGMLFERCIGVHNLMLFNVTSSIE